MKPLLFTLVATVMFGANNLAAETRFQSGPAQTSLVELYTSEGCSSCPPAEAWLSRQKENPGLWKNFVPLAFHVDYWDRLGWRDRFSSKQWTERQSRYAALWRSESVYTPAVVVNGREERGWSGTKLSSPNDKKTGILDVTTSDGKTFAVEFRPADGAASDFEVHLALLGSGISTKVGAGENSGRNLAHDFVVLDLQNAELKSGSGTARGSVTTAAKPESGARKAVAVWATRRGQLVPLQATGGWLP
ncbi:MAG: DUF1223 domain-containing protein [Spartobacteria bacterium]